MSMKNHSVDLSHAFTPEKFWVVFQYFFADIVRKKYRLDKEVI